MCKSGRTSRVKKISADHWTPPQACWSLSRTDIAASQTGAAESEAFLETSAGGRNMEITVENENNNSSGNFEFKAAHQAFRDRWKATDDTMCRHSMSFHLHHKLQSDFFASYLYLLEKIPLGKRQRSQVGLFAPFEALRSTQGLRKPIYSEGVIAPSHLLERFKWNTWIFATRSEKVDSIFYLNVLLKFKLWLSDFCRTAELIHLQKANINLHKLKSFWQSRTENLILKSPKISKS